jgi:hypothetical protein
MEPLLNYSEKLVTLCSQVDASEDRNKLDEAVKALIPELQFERVLTRSNWHRLGGVVDANYQPVSSNIGQWAGEASEGDVDTLIAKYLDKGYFATNLAGKTHYFTAPVGDYADQFIQLEIEELQEVICRPLVEHDWYPDTIEEFIDPIEYSKLEPEPVGKSYYQFRRIIPIATLLAESQKEDQAQSSLKRFFQDWHNSSANECSHFCRQWVLTLRDYMDSNGDCRVKARPYAIAADRLPELPPGEKLHGVDLANAIHGYDRQMGYHFAWYFIMLSRKASNFRLAEAVLRDQMGAYDYLPVRDVKVLRGWEERPYGV